MPADTVARMNGRRFDDALGTVPSPDDAYTVHAGLVHAFMVTAAAAPGGFVGHRGGVVMAFTGSSVAFFNQILVTDHLATIEDWQAAVREARRRVPGFATHLRIGPDDRFERLARRVMLPIPAAPTPGMILKPLPEAPPRQGVEIRSDPDLLSTHIQLVAGAFNLPVSAIKSFMTSGIVDVPGLSIHVGYAGGIPVATSFSLVHGETVNIFNVATNAAYRGRGLGTALTQAAIDAGRDRGATVACLQSSAMGVPVYERMGFRTVLRYAELMTEPGG